MDTKKQEETNPNETARQASRYMRRKAGRTVTIETQTQHNSSYCAAMVCWEESDVRFDITAQ